MLKSEPICFPSTVCFMPWCHMLQFGVLSPQLFFNWLDLWERRQETKLIISIHLMLYKICYRMTSQVKEEKKKTLLEIQLQFTDIFLHAGPCIFYYQIVDFWWFYWQSGQIQISNCKVKHWEKQEKKIFSIQLYSKPLTALLKWAGPHPK